MFKKLFNTKFFIDNVKIKDAIAYKFCIKSTFLGISFRDTLDTCHDKKSLDETMKLFNVRPNECKNYPEN